MLKRKDLYNLKIRHSADLLELVKSLSKGKDVSTIRRVENPEDLNAVFTNPRFIGMGNNMGPLAMTPIVRRDNQYQGLGIDSQGIWFYDGEFYPAGGFFQMRYLSTGSYYDNTSSILSKGKRDSSLGNKHPLFDSLHIQLEPFKDYKNKYLCALLEKLYYKDLNALRDKTMLEGVNDGYTR